MSTELEVLKSIFQIKDKISVRLISTYLGFRTDYIRFICKRSEERDLLKAFGQNWYRITAKVRKNLKEEV